jgi:formate hydrogenlyase transcriptional activator
MFYTVAKLAVLYTFEAYPQALDTARQAEAIIRQDFSGTIWDELRTFYHALILSARYTDAPPEERQGMSGQLETMHRRLRWWAENSPQNFQAQHLMVSAELARMHGRSADAMVLYETAIAASATYERVSERALANELYARFWLERGQPKVAAVFMAEARSGYAQWGAAAKVTDLERKYQGILNSLSGAERRAPLEAPAPALDLSTVLKAARAITSELVLEDFLRELVRIAIENAGAQRGVFLQEQDGQLMVAAAGTVEAGAVQVVGLKPVGSDVPLSLAAISYVRETGESLVVGDACADERFANDPYMVSAKPRSLMCVPIVQHGKLGGMLYLENNLVPDAFTADRVEILRVLSAQAAISLENAKLYAEMQQEVVERRRAEDELHRALAEVETLKNRLQQENVSLQEEIRQEHNFEEMVGRSPALLEMLQKVELVAPTDSTVLLYGETGTGKELVARALHDRSARKDRPLVKVNCGAIAAGLVESELFGHMKGAFTGALERRIGRFELANGGTIFLDEIGELPLETQVKLLRVLQEQEFEPVGSSRTVHVTVRVIAATNRDLEEAVRAGRFRSDLFYRLHVFPIQVPPLRDRRSDIPQLVMFFLARFAKKLGKTVEAVPQGVMDLLIRYDWPGNIRELQNLIERAVVLSQGPVLRLDRPLLPTATLDAVTTTAETVSGVADTHGQAPEGRTPSASPVLVPALPLEEVEKRHILQVLKQTRGVVEGPKGAARILNLHPNTLRSRIKKLGITHADYEIS